MGSTLNLCLFLRRNLLRGAFGVSVMVLTLSGVVGLLIILQSALSGAVLAKGESHGAQRDIRTKASVG
jgi:hypothetical protein